MELIARLSPNGRARLAGIFEFLEGGASSSFQVFVLGTIVVQGNAAATAHNILASETLIRWGFLVSMLGVVFHVGWGLLMYQLMRIVDRTIALFAVFILIITGVFQALTAFFYLAPLLALQSGLNPDQAQGLVVVLLRLNTLAFQVDLAFFGMWCLLTGYLIWKSTFLPRILGILFMADGVGWSLYLWPPLAIYLFPVIAVVSALAELPMQFWLIFFGANTQRWYEQARRGQAATAEIMLAA